MSTIPLLKQPHGDHRGGNFNTYPNADRVQLPETPFSLAYAKVSRAANVMTTAPPTTICFITFFMALLSLIQSVARKKGGLVNIDGL